MPTNKPIAFVLSATHHGTMIVNRNDYCGSMAPGQGFGVGHQLLNYSQFDPPEINTVLSLPNLRRHYFGDGVVALDGGANIGVHSLEWSRLMYGWGQIIAFEAQQWVFYALAGNLALNNCFNVDARWAALGSSNGTLDIPVPNYTQPASFGSLELQSSSTNEFIGQQINYAKEHLRQVPMISLDSLQLPRVDFIKLDVEGMEMSVLQGALHTLQHCRPILWVETLKSKTEDIQQLLHDCGYRHFHPIGPNMLVLHENDPCHQHVQL